LIRFFVSHSGSVYFNEHTAAAEKLRNTNFDFISSFNIIFPTRDPSEQAGYQMLALLITLTVAIAGGAASGFLLKLKIFDNLSWEEYYEDSVFWEVRRRFR